MNRKKSQQICSISNFSSNSQNTLTEITHDINDLIKETKKNLKPDYNQPVYIISPNFQSKHINALTQLLQDYGIPIQFQSATDSLGVELNTNFFVVVDNKTGIKKLGSQFNLPIFTVVGYPKTGPNKQNIYCQYAEDVFNQYKEFTKKMTNKPVSKLSEKTSVVKVNQSMLKSGSNAFSMLSSQSNGIRLKSISKYDRKTRQNSLVKQSLKGKSTKNTQNKQNIVSTRSIMKKKQPSHNLYFLENTNNQNYNNLIKKLHGQIRASNSQFLDRSIVYCNSENDIINRLNSYFDNDNDEYKQTKKNDLKSSRAYEKKLVFIVLNSEMALKMSTRMQSEFYTFKDQIKFITVMLTKQNNFDNKQLEKEMLVIKKSVQSSLFHSVVCSEQECYKILKSLGFMSKTQKSKRAITISQSEQSAILEKQLDEMTFCPDKKPKNKVSSQYQQNEVQKTQKSIKSQFKQVSFKHVDLGHSNISEESYRDQYKQKNPISTISPAKSKVSSKSSKIKIIKVLKKSPSNNLSSENQQTKSKTISEVNSQYCINKNKSIVQKLQQKIISSKRSLSSQKSIKSSSKSKIEKKKIKKSLKVDNEQPFITQCSQVSFSQDQYFEDSHIKKQRCPKQMSCTPFSVNDYYFGSSQVKQSDKKPTTTTAYKASATMDGLLYIEYNDLVQSIVNQFKENCPEKVINKNNIKPFYLAVEYSRQLRKVWKNGRHRKFLPLLIDLQGMNQVYKYYSNFMYEEDEKEFSSVMQSDLCQQNEQYMQNTGNFTMGPNHMKNIPQLMIIFALVSQKQADAIVFQRFEKLSARLPRCQVIKCVVSQNMEDNEMRQKSKQIYEKMMEYFIDLGDDHGDKFVHTI